MPNEKRKPVTADANFSSPNTEGYPVAWLEERLTTEEAALVVRLKPQTLAKRRMIGAPPLFERAGSRVVYRRRDLLSWLESHRYRSTAEATAKGGQ